MKVFTVWQDSYGELNLVAICASRERADKFIAAAVACDTAVSTKNYRVEEEEILS